MLEGFKRDAREARKGLWVYSNRYGRGSGGKGDDGGIEQDLFVLLNLAHVANDLSIPLRL